MALSPEPAWRVKTRPCPFYQQGRCLFGDSCNFVHSAVFIQSPTPSDTICIRLEPGTPKSPPATVHSPRSVRSPPRSPRLSGLLLALKDVIGEDNEDEYDDSAEATYVDPNEHYEKVKVADDPQNPLHDELQEEEASESSGSISVALPIVSSGIDSETSDHSSDFEAQVSIPSDGYSHDTEAQLLMPPTEDLSPQSVSLPKSTTSPTLLSPVDISQLRLSIFNRIDDDSPKMVINNGEFEDTFDLNTREYASSLLTSPPSPLKSTFGVLSSPFATASSRVISPRLSAFISRQPQSPFAPQAVVDEDVPADLSLDSPVGGFNSDTEVQPSEEYIVIQEERSQETSGIVDDDAEDDFEESDESLDNEEYVEEGNSFASSSWDDQTNPTVVYLGLPPATPEEVRAAVQETRQTPTHFLSNEIDFDEDEAAANSSIPESSFDSPPRSPTTDDCESFGDPTMDYTAKLAYLTSPIHINENDTLQSLYDQYSDLPETGDETPQDKITGSDGISRPEIEPSPLSATRPFKVELPRARVFTPPPTTTQSRSEAAIAPADSSHSPLSSQSALSQSRSSSRSQSVRSAWSPDSADSELPATISTKVPFGFRKIATQRRASRRESSGLSKLNSSVAEPLPVAIPQNSTHLPDRSSHNSSVPSGLKPLRLSSVLTTQPFSAPPRNSIFTVNSYRQQGNLHRASISSSASVLSDKSYSRNPLLLSAFPSSIPEHIRRISRSSSDDLIPSPLSSCHLGSLATFESPQSAPITRPVSWLSSPPNATGSVVTSSHHSLPRSLTSELSWPEEDDQEDTANYDRTVRYAIPDVPHSAPNIQRDSVTHQSMFSAATPKPTLMFAIASDNVKEVQRVLESGNADPNDATGPLSALEFTLTNDQLNNKVDIIKTLLAFGADPQAVISRGDAPSSSPNNGSKEGTAESLSGPSLMDCMDPAIRYYIERADAPHTRRTSALIHRSFFRPLTRVRYEMIGQDWALEQLFRDLSMHSRQLSVTPIVVLLCGPSGHGKSLLARKFGSLLGVATHTVDMPTIHSTQDLWKSYSMSPYDPPSTRTLAEFLIDNEGKRCVVVLDEIEKTPEKSSLWPLLMPWEHGRCTFEANGRLVDVRNVVWLSTSNIGQELIFEHHNARKSPTQPMSREEYNELMGLMRPRVSERLGTSILSRVTTVLPFVPFTPEEKRAICYEALHTIAGDIVKTLPTNVVDSMVAGALANHTPAEGARSLYRAVSNQLVDNI